MFQAAKQNLIAMQKVQQQKGAEPDMPSNLTANYKHHRREHYLNVIEPSRGGGDDARAAMGVASDEAAYARFKKRAKQRSW